MDCIVARTHGFKLYVTALLISFLTECRTLYSRVLYGVWPVQVEQTVDCWGLKTIGTQHL